MELLFSEPMCSRTSLRVGGPAMLWCEAQRSELHTVLRLADKLREPITVLGGGTNMLVSDNGINAFVLRLTSPKKLFVDDNLRRQGGLVDVRVSSSMPWDSLVECATDERLQGLECLTGIPGTVGAAPVQNIGAYGQQVSDVIASVTAYDQVEGRFRTMSNEECGFRYRKSIFNLPENLDRFIITEVIFRLHRDGYPCRAHDEVKRATRVTASCRDIRSAVLAIRKRKGMLEGMVASAGSFFKNPVVSSEVTDAFIDRLGGTDWFWPTNEGMKLSAARLMEEAGYPKGYARRKAGISPHHALALVNLGGACADDICGLAYDIQKAVMDKFGVLLEPEVRLIGFKQYPLLQ